MRSYYVYIVSNFTRSVFYTGMTNDIQARIHQHKSGGGSKFTAKYKCFYLVYLEEYPSAIEAISREKNLKNWHREWKINLINQQNPEMKDLAESWFS